MRWPTVVFRVLLAVLLIPAVVLTVLRFLQPDVGVLIRTVSFTPLALPLYFASFLLLLFAVVRRRGGGRRLVTAGVVVSLAGLAVHAFWVAPLWTGSAAEPADDSLTYRVMTLNLLRGHADAAEVIETAAEEGVSVLVLEEMTPEALAELEEFGLAEAFPFRAGEPDDGITGTMAFATHRIRVAERLDTDLGSWSFEVVMPTRSVRMYAVHVRPPWEDAEAWADDLDALADAADGDRELDLIIGDLNATPDHQQLQRFADLDFRSSAERTNAGWQPTWPDNGKRKLWFVPMPRLVQIDHILLGRTMAATQTGSTSIDGTDHRAVIAEVGAR